MFPTITIDPTYFTNIINEILSQPNPFLAAWILIKIGGWIPLAIFASYGAKYLYMDFIQTRWAMQQKCVLLAIDIPKGNEQTPKAVENIFAHFAGTKASLNFKDEYISGKFQWTSSLEIVSIGGDIQFYIRTLRKFRDLVEAAIYSQYPDAEITEAEEYSKNFPRQFPHEKYEMFGCDFKLSSPDYFPIRTYPQFEHGLSAEFKDPMSLILETLSSIKKEEVLALQILVTACNDDWRKKGEKEVQKMLGKAPPVKKGIFGGVSDLAGELVEHAVTGGAAADKQKDKKNDDMFKMLAMSPGERKVVEGVEMKLSKVGFPCKVRYIHFAPHEIFQNKYAVVKGFLKQFAVLNSNTFSSIIKTMPKRNYWYHRMIRPYKQRWLMNAFIGRDTVYGGPQYILNIEELATLWHFPVLEVKAPSVKKTEAKRAEPPRGLPIR
ncbi:hypothetical protein ACFL29_02355 [Patescibacteria group bacterium]